MKELMIIGGGPAGLTAALYAARKRIDTLMVTNDIGGQVNLTFGIENYMGFQFITGQELTEKFKAQVDQFPIEKHLGEEIERLEQVDNYFVARAKSGREFKAKTCIIASGARSRQLNVPGEDKFRGRGVSYCATCDAPLFADTNVAVIGGGNSALSAAFELSRIARTVHLVSRRQRRADEAPLVQKVKEAANIFPIVGYEVQEIQGKELVTGAVIKSKETGELKQLDVEGIFIEIGLIPNTEFVKHMLQLNEFGEIVVNCDTWTGIPGLFAAGDVTNVRDKQIIIAGGQGALAAMGVFEHLLKSQ